MIVPRRPVALLLTGLALAVAGCGGKSPDGAMSEHSTRGDNQLAASDAASVLEARRTIDASCGSDGSATPDSLPTQIAGAVSTLVALTKQYPDQVFETGNEDRAQKLSRVSSEVATQLRRCGIIAQADRLTQAAKS